jgi:hypothetical protein
MFPEADRLGKYVIPGAERLNASGVGYAVVELGIDAGASEMKSPSLQTVPPQL